VTLSGGIPLEASGLPYEFLRGHLLAPTFSNVEVRTLLSSLLEDEQRLERVAQQSYSHELRFTKIILWRDPVTHSVLRIHIWDTRSLEPSPVDYDIHNHGRHFTSYVMLGKLRHQTWGLCTPGDPFEGFTYSLDDQRLVV